MLRLRMYLFYLIVLLFGAQAQSVTDIRQQFHQAVLDPEQSRDFHDYLDDANLSDATVKAYKAVSEAMLAQVVWNPFAKLSQVKKYNRLISEAVSADSGNIEIRFLRLAIEYNLPSFLGYSTHLQEDRDVILMNISSISTIHIDPAFSRYILYFLDETGLCDPEQIVLMETSIKGNPPQAR